MDIFLKLLLFYAFLVQLVLGSEYELTVTTDSPVAQGSQVTFNLTLLRYNKPAPKAQYQLEYRFEGLMRTIDFTSSNLSFSLQTDDLNQGTHEVAMRVSEIIYLIIPREIASAKPKFLVANFFSGTMDLVQNQTTRTTAFVSSKNPTLHNLTISQNDLVLFDRAKYYRVFWFVNCQYVGQSDTLNYQSWYQKENEKFDVEAVLMLSFTPLPPVTTTTTTTTTTTPKTTTTTTTTTTSTTTTTPKTTTSTTTTSTTTTTPKTTTSTTTPGTTTSTPSTTTSSTTSTTTTTPKPSARRRRQANGITKSIEWNADYLIKSGLIKPNDVSFGNATDPPVSFTTTTHAPSAFIDDDQIPYFGVCTNKTRVMTDHKKTYGYYKRSFTVQNNVENITVDGDLWLKHGDLCKLDIKYIGTGPFKYCTVLKSTKNSTALSSVLADPSECDFWTEWDGKSFKVTKFLSIYSDAYSLIVFVKNEVSLASRVVGINFYKPIPRSQLSVIIVPVIFTLISIFLIIFGVAYYMQNRNQFLVETADFNFGETQSIDSLEYKSFLQRLLDSISDVFIRNNYIDDSGSPPNGESSQGYNSMQ